MPRTTEDIATTTTEAMASRTPSKSQTLTGRMLVGAGQASGVAVARRAGTR